MNSVPTSDQRVWQPETAGWPRRLAEIFGIDLRSLAAFRIGLGLWLLFDLFNRAQDLTAHYTDAGVLPRIDRIRLYTWAEQDGGRYLWSLHMLSGEAWAQIVLFGIAAVCAGCLLVGYQTRVATILSWLLTLSLDGRNPMINDGGDMLMEAMLLWSIFLPLGAIWSLDARRQPLARPMPVRVVSAGTVAALLQLCLMYWLTAYFKLSDVWAKDYTAVYYVMNVDIFTTRLGNTLREFPAFMAVLTFLTLWGEWLVPAICFLPWQTGKCKMTAVLFYWLFHCCLMLTLELGLFPWACIVCWILFIPTGVWEWLAARNWFVVPLEVPTGTAPVSSNCLRLPKFVNFAAGALLLVVVLWNIRSADEEKLAKYTVPAQLNGVIRVLGLDQAWTLFAPSPIVDDGWYEMAGTLRDRTVVNLWQPYRPLPKEKPELVSATYVNQRWRKYLLNLSFAGNSAHKLCFCEWLKWNWNQAQGKVEKKLAKLEIIYHLERTPEPGQPALGVDLLPWVWRDPLVPDPDLPENPLDQ